MTSMLPHADRVAMAVFCVLAVVILVSGIAVITRRNPVAAVAWLVVHFVGTACAYIVLDSQFIAAVQVLVYAGAIMVLFLFVIMLLSADCVTDTRSHSGLGRRVLVAASALVLLTAFARLLAEPGGLGLAAGVASPPAAEDTVGFIAGALFSRHLVAFELSSVPLLAAMAGVLVYTTRRVVVPRSGGHGR